jgi:co-chaperonin GroES (HSP10)
MKTTLRPLHDRVLVKRLEEQDETRGADESKVSAATGHAVN